MPTLDPVHAIICDPPYELGFMGKAWDKTGIANDVKMWAECLRVLRPGGHLLSFGGSRTYHRMACAIEDAGFEIRDQIMWLYGSGFPKSLDVSKAIDKAAGAERETVGMSATKSGIADGNRGPQNRDTDHAWAAGKSVAVHVPITTPATDAARQWDGWGTALKPAHEPICVARKPIEGTVAANVLKWGTGAINVDGCRVGYLDDADKAGATPQGACTAKVGALAGGTQNGVARSEFARPDQLGRWPANVIHDGSDEVLECFPVTASAAMTREVAAYEGEGSTGFLRGRSGPQNQRADEGSAARFFYTAKASREERHRNVDGYVPQTQHGATLHNIENAVLKGNNHPTVKPLDLMAYLCKLLCPPSGGILLDPFMGSGSTIIAGRRFYQHCIGIELNEAYAEIAAKRLSQEVLDFGGTE